LQHERDQENRQRHEGDPYGPSSTTSVWLSPAVTTALF
jgi:hypothetical protein